MDKIKHNAEWLAVKAEALIQVLPQSKEAYRNRLIELSKEYYEHMMSEGLNIEEMKQYKEIKNIILMGIEHGK
jgi:hypothetical protein